MNMNKKKNMSFCGNEEYYKNYIDYLGVTRNDFVNGAIKWEEIIDILGHKPYVDPDGTYHYKESTFYNKLKDFLNKQSNNNTYNFKHNDGIITNIDGKELILRSDQFGFSAPQHKKNNKGKYISKAWKYVRNNRTKYSYPYGKYLLFEQNDDDLEFVASTIWSTRRLGGSFIWPIKKGSRFNNLNINRGVASYIEDRVDYTLQEIKLFYHFYNLNKDSSVKDIYDSMCNACKKYNYVPEILKGDDKDLIFIWLKHFGSFKNYINFFMFDKDFVDEDYNVINIVTGKKIEVNKEQVITEKIISIDSLSKKDIKKMLLRLVSFIDNRTIRMEE